MDDDFEYELQYLTLKSTLLVKRRGWWYQGSRTRKTDYLLY